VKLDGHVALVTGGGSGIGRATATLLAVHGMRVCGVDINADTAEAAAEEIGGFGLACDVSDPEQVDATFALCAREFGTVDLAFLNAGVSIRWSGDIAALEDADYRRSVGVNLDGVVFGARAAVRTMRSCAGADERAIVATASLAGILPWHPDPVYSLGKHAVVGFMRAIAPNLSTEGIAVHRRQRPEGGGLTIGCHRVDVDCAAREAGLGNAFRRRPGARQHAQRSGQHPLVS
jgi:NAD(P)-dependent dehydrogenase (short-subunit alcohol dehydrogenase family)